MKTILRVLAAVLPVVLALMVVDACKKLPWEVPVTDITLNARAVELNVGDTHQMIATVSPSDATNQKINWQTSNEKIVAVDMNGLVTAVSEGKATVTAKTDEGSVSESCEVTVVKKNIPVKNVILSTKTLKLVVGESEDISVTIVPEDATDKRVSWSSGNDKVASVEDGKVTALSAGDTEVTVVTADGGKTAVCHVYVTEKGVSVESVALDKTKAELEIGEDLQLTATVYPDNATDKEVTWSSSASAVATVSDAGVVSALSAGTAVITVKTVSGGKTAKCEVTVKAAPVEEPDVVSVTSVSLDKTSAELTEGDELTLTATVNPDNATDKSVTWSSSDVSVASVADGKVTALKAGTATITVTTTDGGKTAKCEVTVKAAPVEEPDVVSVTSVSLDKTSAELTEGDELTLTATVNPDNATDKSVTWSSSDASVASVADGKVIALKAGTATITVTTTDGSNTATCEVTVKAAYVAVTSVTLDKTSVEIMAGHDLTLTATVNPENATDKSVTWTSSNEAVASVENGKVTALTVGTATITVTTTDGAMTASCEVSVAEQPVVTLKQTSAEMTVGEEITLAASVTIDGTELKWSSSDATVASVENGKVTALKAGTATITVTTADGGSSASCEVTVNEFTGEVTGVTINKSSAILKIGDTLTLTAVITPSNATDTSVTWTTSNSAVASVADGVVTALKVGTATIAVTTNDGGKTAYCSIKVITNEGNEGVGENQGNWE